MNVPVVDPALPVVEPDPVDEVDSLVGAHLVANVTIAPAAKRAKSFTIQLAPRSPDDAPAWQHPLWSVTDGPLKPQPQVRFDTLDGCEASQGMTVGSRRPTVRLSTTGPVASYRWRLSQFATVIDQGRVDSVEGDAGRTISDDRQCITITPSRGAFRQGPLPRGTLFPPFTPDGRRYQGRTYGELVNDDGSKHLPHHAYAVDFNRKKGQDLGQPVLAAAAGTVLSVDTSVNGRNTVKIAHFNGERMTQYTHLQTILVKEGQQVAGLDQIGTIGDVGAEGHPHLHHSHHRRLPNGDYLPVKMRILGRPYDASIAQLPRPAGAIGDWRVANDIRALDPRNVLFGRDIVGFDRERPVAVFRIALTLASGVELERRLRFMVSRKAIPGCPDSGCVPGGAPATVKVDRAYDGPEVAPGAYSIRYRVTDDLGAVSPWVYDHGVVVSGSDPDAPPDLAPED